MSYQTYEFTAFAEADLLEGGNSNLGVCDTFTMPGGATVCMEVTDNDGRLSGDSRHNENATDQTGQTASIEDLSGNELGNGGQVYAEVYYWVCDDAGNWYLMIEIEQEGSNDDYFTFHEAYGVPEAGTELYVACKGNVRDGCWTPDYKCLSSGEKPEPPTNPWEFDEETCTYTVEAENWDLQNFHVVDGDQASGGELVKISGDDGKISTEFGGESGVYNMTISVQDEADGASKLMVYVNGEFQQTIRLNENDDGWGSDDSGFSEFTLNGLEIGEGDVVEIRAWKDNCEYVRIDKIEFEQVKFEECDLDGAVKLDFEGFAAGDVLGDLDGLTISATGGSGDAMVFDSQNPTGGDSDLETQQAQLGNVLIVSEDGDSSDPDDVVGGTLTFDFDNPSTVFDLKFIDTEEGGTVTLTLADGSTQTFDIPELVNGGVGQLVMNVENVVSMEIAMDGSGAIDDLCYVPGAEPLGSLSGRYFFDENRDGLDNDAGNAIAGVMVALLDENGVATGATTTTDANGNYSFGDLAAGTYGVKFTDTVDGRELTTQNVDADASDAIDSDAADIGGGMSTISNIVVVAGADTPDNDAGVVEELGSLSGRYFFDENRNGLDDDDGNGISGVTVELLDENGNGTNITVQTDGDGNYSFGDLIPGDYGVKFTDTATGRELTTQNVDGDVSDAIDSDAGDIGGGMSTITGITVNAGQDTPDNDAGVVEELGSLSGRYFCDDDYDDTENNGTGLDVGVAGFTVVLLDANGAPVLDAAGNQVTTTTGADGSYSFTGLSAGDYGVQFVGTPPTKDFVEPNVNNNQNDDVDSDAIDNGDGTATISTITVTAGNDTPDNDVGVSYIPGSLSGRYFCDENGDNVDNDGVNGVAGVAVMLLDSAGNPATDVDGNLVASVMTGADGSYSFANLAPGSYSVKFTDAVSGGELVTANQGGDDANDSDATDLGGGMSQIDNIVVAAAANTPDNDAGVKGTASVGDIVWVDTNGDGELNNGEQGRDNVLVRLLADLDGDGDVDDVVATTSTQDGGMYSFEGLKAGDYAIRFEDVDGFDFTTEGDDDDDAVNNDSDADQVTGETDVFTLSIGEAETDIDAGLVAEPPANNDPEPMDDAAMACADDEVTVDVLANDGTVISDPFLGDLVVDSDGDPLTITQVDGQAISEGVTITTGAGTFVTLTDGQLVVDGEAAYASLDIGETAPVENISYTVSDGQGGSATANLAMTFKGDANSVDSFNASLPDSIVDYQIRATNNVDPFEPEAFQIKITGTGDARLDNMVFENAYCLSIRDPSADTEDFATAPLNSADMFGASELPTGFFNNNQVSFANGQTAAENMDLVNYILNQEYEGNGFSGWEVQLAIWEMTDSFDTDVLVDFNPGYGDKAKIDQIVNDALLNGEGFEAGVGDVMGLVLDPNPSTSTNSQPFIIAVNWEDYDCIC